MGKFAFFFCRLLIFFSKINLSKNSFRNTIRVSNSLDSDQARQNVGPDLCPNCLKKLSADDTSRQSVNLCMGKTKIVLEIQSSLESFVRQN